MPGGKGNICIPSPSLLLLWQGPIPGAQLSPTLGRGSLYRVFPRPLQFGAGPPRALTRQRRWRKVGLKAGRRLQPAAAGGGGASELRDDREAEGD